MKKVKDIPIISNITFWSTFTEEWKYIAKDKDSTWYLFSSIPELNYNGIWRNYSQVLELKDISVKNL